eukprot:scaffold50569_cov33-Tisochrysis_lutea.AAC.3
MRQKDSIHPLDELVAVVEGLFVLACERLESEGAHCGGELRFAALKGVYTLVGPGELTSVIRPEQLPIPNSIRKAVEMGSAHARARPSGGILTNKQRTNRMPAQ